MGFGFNFGRSRISIGTDKDLILPLLSKEVSPQYDAIDFIPEPELKTMESSIKEKLTARNYHGYHLQLKRNIEIFTPDVPNIAFYLMDTIFPKNPNHNDPSTWGVVSLFLYTPIPSSAKNDDGKFSASSQRLVIYKKENFTFFYPIIKAMFNDRDFSACSVDIKLKSKNSQNNNLWGTYARILNINK